MLATLVHKFMDCRSNCQTSASECWGMLQALIPMTQQGLLHLAK